MRALAHHGRHARQQAPAGLSYLIVALAALAALLAACVFASQSGQAAQARVTAPHAALLDRTAETAAVSEGSLLARARSAAARTVLTAARARAFTAAHTYTVRAGDSISSVAQKHCGHARDWTGIYAASRLRHMTAKNANVLTAEQHLWLSCSWDPHQLGFAPAAPPPPRISSTSLTSGNTGTYSHYRRSATSASYGSSTYHGSGSMEQCIIAAESGGNSQVMNSSGHYGLYQFSYSTWVASGGSPSSFGHASVAEQRAAFQNAVAARGYSDWTPYDGC